MSQLDCDVNTGRRQGVQILRTGTERTGTPAVDPGHDPAPAFIAQREKSQSARPRDFRGDALVQRGSAVRRLEQDHIRVRMHIDESRHDGHSGRVKTFRSFRFGQIADGLDHPSLDSEVGTERFCPGPVADAPAGDHQIETHVSP